MSEMIQADDLHLLRAIAPKVHIDAPAEEVLPAEGRSEGGNDLFLGVGVDHSSAEVVGAVRRNGDLQYLVAASFVEDAESALRLQLVVAE